MRTLIIVAGLTSLREEWGRIRSLCWSDNTIKAKKTQWKRYFGFCSSYDIFPLPVDIEGVCLYIVHLTSTVCYLTITQYVSGLWSLHKYLGYPYPDPNSFLIISTLRGAKRLLGASTNPALPLTPQNLLSIRGTLDLTSSVDFKFWCALLLSFRCLLRVSHITKTPHQLLARDIHFNALGMDIIIRSSKTVQFRERINRIPVVESVSSALCPVGVLRQYMSRFNKKGGDPLFSFNYNNYNSKLKQACKDIGLEGHYSTHSVRRGSASYLATFLPLHDVKAYGDWRSWAVLLYLSDSYESRKSKDLQVADRLSDFV